MKIILFRLIVLVVLQVTTLNLVYGGGIGRIGGPVILPFVKHKVLVLEFESPQEKTWGSDISQIIAQEFLGSVKGVFNFGVVNLLQQQDRVEYTPDNIKKIANQQKGLIVIWGEFYFDESNIYIHCHLRIIPQNKFPASALGLTAELEGFKLKAEPATLQVNFNPVRISIESLKRMHDFYYQTVNLRTTPNDEATIKGQLKPGDTYFIKGREGNWINIILSSGKSGWIKYATLEDQRELNPLRGLIRLGQGILQFMAGKFPIAVESLRGYVSDFSAEEDNMNRCFSHLLLGISILRAENYDYSIPQEEQVSTQFFKATELLPDHASPVNHLAIVTIMKEFERHQGSFTEFEKIEKQLVHVIKTENDINAVNNLRALYNISMRSGNSEFQNLIRSRLLILDRIKLELESKK